MFTARKTFWHTQYLSHEPPLQLQTAVLHLLHTTLMAHAGWLEGQLRQQPQLGVTCCPLNPEAILPPGQSLPWLWQEALPVSPQPAMVAQV